jgi:hypothetical protein
MTFRMTVRQLVGQELDRRAGYDAGIITHPASELKKQTTTCHSFQRLFVLHFIEQLKHCQAKRICYDLNGVETWVSVSILDPAQVGLVEATLFPELDLAQLCL